MLNTLSLKIITVRSSSQAEFTKCWITVIDRYHSKTELTQVFDYFLLDMYSPLSNRSLPPTQFLGKFRLKIGTFGTQIFV